jgi:cytochrome c oxidase subunit IV
MHLVAERKAIYWVLVLTAVFVLVMVGLIMFARGDQQGLQHGIFEVPQGHVPIHPAE